MKNTLFLTIVLAFFPICDIIAQSLDVHGQVTDTRGNTLPGVAVIIKGTNDGAITDAEGRYSIQVPDGTVLEFSCMGYQTKEIEIKDRAVINVTLSETSYALDELVVVAYGTQSKRTSTTSVAKLNNSEIANIPMNTIGDGLKGKLAGARVYNSSGAPGETPEIVIRGGSSINKSNEPLILVDGFPTQLSAVNPSDIESVQILKDAASTALYGSRASNGIVVITTKSGSNSAPKITFSADWSVATVERYYDLLNAEEFLSIIRPSAARSPNPQWNSKDNSSYSSGNTSTSPFSTRYLLDGEAIPEGYKSMPDPLDPSKTLIFQDNDMLKATFRPALRQNYYLSVTGGNNKVKYASSVGYTHDKGVAITTKWERFSTNHQVSYNVRDNITIFGRINYSRANNQNVSDQRLAITRALYLPFTQKLYDENGLPMKGQSATGSPLLWWTDVHKNETTVNRANIQGGIDWNITDHLVFSATGTTFYQGSETDKFDKANAWNSKRTASSSYSKVIRTQAEALLKYSRTISRDHSLSGLLGFSYMQVKNKSLSASAYGASSDAIQTLNAAPIPSSASSSITEERLIGMFAQVQYNYKNKYIVSASLRRDGSSRFGANHRWAYFPGASIGWVISEEKFLKGNEALSFLKLRASIGQTGNNAVGLYEAQGAYSADYKYNFNAGVVNTDMPNPNLTWETTTQTDLGLDIGLCKDRLMITVDGFNKLTNNLLFSKPLPNTSGFSSVTTNIGSVRFYGFDVEISSTNIRKKDFTWETSFTWSFVKNRVESLPDNGEEKNRIGGIAIDDEGTLVGGIAEGEPLYRFYGYKIAYLIDNDEQAASAMYDESAVGYDYRTNKKTKGKKFAGDYEWCDLNGDGKITAQDAGFELGVTVPHSTGGLTNTFTYKGVSLRIGLDWALGHSINDTHWRYHMMSTWNGNANLIREAQSAWTKPGDAANTKYARIAVHDSQENSNYRRVSDIGVFKADYLCLRDVTLSYQFPEKLIDKMKIAGLTLYLSGNNLHYFTAVQAQSPEVGSDNNDSGGGTGYPPVRRVTFGVNLQF